MCYKSTWKCLHYIIINHGGNWLGNELLPLKELLFLWTIEDLFLHKGGKYHWITVITVMQDTGHPGITPGCIFPCFLPCFLPGNVPWYVSRTRTHPVTSSPQKRHHLVVGHTLRDTVSNFEANWTNGSQDTAIFVSYPSPYNFSYSDHYQQLTAQHLRHGFRTNTTTTHLPVCPSHCRCYCYYADS